MRRKKCAPLVVLCRMAVMAAISVMIPAVSSCERSSPDSGGSGVLKVRFSESGREMTRSIPGLPDTNDFILNITSGDGTVVYAGKYGASPETITVPAGSYDVSVRSSEFIRPAFSAPLFGDDLCVVVPEGGTVKAGLECVQLNAGVKVSISPDFLDAYPQHVLLLRSVDGSLVCGYSEKRIAYFNPGNVSLVLSGNGEDRELMSRRLEPQQVLSLKVRVAASAAGTSDGIAINIDTTRVWIDDEFVIGGDGGSGGADAENAMSVYEARESAGQKDVWVTGYIVGGDLTRNSMSFSAPFESETNLVIAARSSVSDKASCLSVELPSGTVRDALNLRAHPGHIGHRIYLYGDIVESYFGIAGIKGVSDFILE